MAWWDDSIYAEVVRETAHSANWLIPTWQGAAWYQKPPLHIWLTAVAWWGVGPSELALRLPAVLLSLIALVAVFEMALELGGMLAAVVAPFILFTTPHFFHFARRLMMDGPLSSFLILAICFFLRGIEQPRFRFWAGVAWGLALMTKGAAALPLFAAVAIFLLGAVGIRKRQKGLLLASLGWGILLASLWHIYMLIAASPQFLREYFVYHVWQRTLTPELGHGGGWSYYLHVLYAQSGLWSWAFLLGVSFAVWASVRDRPRGEFLLLIYVLVFLVLFTVAETKFEYYILPTYPALAVLAALALSRFAQKWRATIPVLLAVLAVAGWQITRPDFFHDPANTSGFNREIRTLARRAAEISRPEAILYSYSLHSALPQVYSGRHVLYLCPQLWLVRAYFDYPGTDRIPFEQIRWCDLGCVRKLARETPQFTCLLRQSDFDHIWPASEPRPQIVAQAGELLLVRSLH